MSEIEKMYELAGIKPIAEYCKHQCNDEFNDNACIGCKHIEKVEYPPFTAEKQIAILKLLTINRGILIKQNVFFTNLENPEKTIGTENIDSNFEEGFASLINILWQDLTEEEKQQVKGILE